MSEIFDSILEYVDNLTICDTHEHLPGRLEYLCNPDMTGKNRDILREYLMQRYFACDLKTAGLSEGDYEKLMDPDIPISERWGIVEPYWNYARHTGYGKVLDLAAKDLYGFERIDRETIEPLNNAFLKAYGSGAYQRVLKKKSKIAISIIDSDLACDRRYFVSAFRLDGFILTKSAQDITNAEKRTGIAVRSFDGWLDACSASVADAASKGAVAFKIGMAYDRTLAVGEASYAGAAQRFNSFLRDPRLPAGAFSLSREYSDYMIDYILREVEKKHLPVQIHTGIQAGNGNDLPASNPSHLCPLLLRFPHLHFDLFHIGYPYYHETAAIGKLFANVSIDMCWAHAISPNASACALQEFLDVMPYNKICAFGGDYRFADGVYGHQKLARRNVSRVLAAKVEEGSFDVPEAKHIAKVMFYDNPVRIFRLDEAIRAM